MHSSSTTIEDNAFSLPRLVFLSLGSNLGDRWWILQGALEEISKIEGYRLLDVAPVWETPPWGEIEQPRFLNTVVALEALEGTPEALLETILMIESRFGRVRNEDERWGPRTLDIDLLIWDEETRQHEALQIPHPRILEREFVTVPLGYLIARHREWHHPWLREWRVILPVDDRVFGGPMGQLHFPV